MFLFSNCTEWYLTFKILVYIITYNHAICKMCLKKIQNCVEFSKCVGDSHPVPALENADADERDGCRKQDHVQITIPPQKLGHAHKIHTVPARN